MSDNVSAISTAPGVGGVAIIRISGDSPLLIASKMFKPLAKIKVEDFEPYKLYVGEIDGGHLPTLECACISRVLKAILVRIWLNFIATAV